MSEADSATGASLLHHSERQDAIVRLAKAEGFVAVEALAQRFGVTPQTIRRDINALCAAGLLRRHHGGAVPLSSTANLGYAERQVTNREAKLAIGRAVARHVPHDTSLFINIGTTNEAVAAALTQHRGLQVITNNLNVAATLAPQPELQVIVTGGLVRGRDLGVVGEATLDVIGQFRVDMAIIGISGIDEDGTLLDFDYREVRVAQAIIANARSVILAVDQSKFGRRAMARLGHLGDVDHVFCDAPPPPPLGELLGGLETRWHVADTNSDHLVSFRLRSVTN